MSGIAILLLIVLCIWILWPILSRWLRRKASEKTEDFLRDAMGMPPRPGSRKEKRQRKNSYQESYGGSGYRNRQKKNPDGSEPLIPKEYAEDVEYVETKEFSEERLKGRQDTNKREYREKQVSDAEWTDIK